MRPGSLENILRARPFVTVFRVDGNENVALFDLSLVPLSLVLGDTHPH